MDKVFNLEIDGQITLPDGHKLGPLYETPIKIVQPSDADAAIENAKETGGFGWTEYGNKVSVDWDGNTEGRPSFVLTSDITGEPLTFYKVSDKVIGPDVVPALRPIVTFSVGMNFEIDDISGLSGSYAFYFGAPDMEETELCAVSVFDTTAAIGDVLPPETGTYFLQVADGFFVTNISYNTTPDTAHTIDPKYISVGNDLLICNLTGVGATWVCDKTFQEIYSAIESNNKTILLHKYGYVFQLVDWDDNYVLFANHYLDTEAGDDDGAIYLCVEYFKIYDNETIHNSFKEYKINYESM